MARRSTKRYANLVDACRHLCEALGFDLDDPNFEDTPERMWKMYRELLESRNPAKLEIELKKLFQSTFPVGHNEMIVLNNIEAFSMCPHHLLPVHYEASIGYVPQGRVLGLSKLPRFVRLMAHRAVLQEQLTSDLADTLMTHITPQGVIVRLIGYHDCMRIRGARSDAMTTTEAVRGLFMHAPQARTEALELMRLRTSG